MRDLSDQERSATKNETVTKSNKETGSDEHAKASSTRLQPHCKQHDETSNETPEPAAPGIDHVRHDEQTEQRAKTHGGIEEAKKRAVRVIEVFLSVGQGLETIHHGTIETVRCVRHDEDDNVDVQGTHILPLPPGHALELLVSEQEMTLCRFNRQDLLARLRGPESQRHDCESVCWMQT